MSGGGTGQRVHSLLPRGKPTPARAPLICKSVNEAEVIALCEGSDVDFRDTGGRPPTPEEESLVTALADSMFFKRPFDKQIKDILHFSTHISARRLGQVPAADRDRLLSQVPNELAEEIVSLLSVGVA